eukprot:NODE_31277_length_400_cov_1.919414.p4 GENE.NODE_31277_length_400_cov_1.919414~~NODE_31277_length_400_cov_1.919414.p4  ORF type:complete len:50 (-),score=2.66 NODE_31277_length_400_cov_1.919414:36-185(-)
MCTQWFIARDGLMEPPVLRGLFATVGWHCSTAACPSHTAALGPHTVESL